MRWTPGARSAVEHALIQTSENVVNAAIDYAEQLALYTGANIVDTDVWIQALIHSTLRHDLPHAQIADASRLHLANLNERVTYLNVAPTAL